jgi:hypothetical protein
MKKIIILSLIMLASISLIATTYIVDPSGQGDFTTIQAAVDAGINSSFLTIIMVPDNHDVGQRVNLDYFTGYAIYFEGENPANWNTVNNTIINGAICFSKYTNSTNNLIISFNGLTIRGSNISIDIADLNASLSAENCKVGHSNSSYAIRNLQSNKVMYLADSEFVGGAIRHEMIANWNSNNVSTRILNSLIKGINQYGIKDNKNMLIDGCTITNNNSQIDAYKLKVNNSIIYGNSHNPSYIYSLISNYSLIQGLDENDYTGTGSINRNPRFSDHPNYLYHLLEGSPCIDAGDPSLTDADGTRLDMGYYPATTDLKTLRGNHWNWESFPRLYRTGNNPVNAPAVLGNMLPMPNELTLNVGENQLLTYYYQTWSPPTYQIDSSSGYRLNPQEAGEYLLPLGGTRLEPDHTVRLYENQPNYVGYWLPQTLDFRDALIDIINEVYLVKAENWWMQKLGGQWYGSPGARTSFVYGKSYEIYVNSGVELTYWRYAPPVERVEKPQTTTFSYQDQPDYEMVLIDTISGVDNIDEVGIFVDGECVGASKFEGYPLAMQAYTSQADRGNQFTFQIASGERSEILRVNSEKYDAATEAYLQQPSFPNSALLTRVRLNYSQDNDEVEKPQIATSYHNNYPNPFNPTTTIEFSIAADNTATKLLIYNAKGQVVNELIDGKLRQGLHNITWDGTDEQSQPVASGIYFYRLIRAEQSINRKMILMK